MELIGIMITGIFMGAFFFGAFCLGYYFGHKHQEKDGVTVTEANKEFIEEMQKWKNFSGFNR